MPRKPQPGHSRPPLNRERVVRGAVDFANAQGLTSLTMRGLGETLGVEGMALYKHVVNKDDLLGSMVDIVLSEIDLPSPGGPWKTELREGATSTFTILLRHPWARQLLVSGGGGSGPARWRQMDAILGTLREGGFSVEMTHHAFHVLDSYVQGVALGTVSFPLGKEETADMAGTFLRAPDNRPPLSRRACQLPHRDRRARRGRLRVRPRPHSGQP